jgi:hypothetical protein
MSPLRISSTCAALALLCACSGDDTVGEGAAGGSVAQDASAGAARANDARSDLSTGGGGTADTGSTTTDVRDGTGETSDSNADVPDTANDARDSGSTPSDVAVEAPSDVLESSSDALDAAGDGRADAMSCPRPTAADGSADGAPSATITNLTGFAATDVALLTWRDPLSSVPRDRVLELRFDPSLGVCSAAIVGQRKANGSQLRIFLLRANYVNASMLPDFFTPGTYPLSDNVYEDAGIASVADIEIVTTDDTCHQTFNQATAGNLTLTSVTPGHASGTFTATFDDAGTISGGFDVDLCFEAEHPECPYACVP